MRYCMGDGRGQSFGLLIGRRRCGPTAWFSKHSSWPRSRCVRAPTMALHGGVGSPEDGTTGGIDQPFSRRLMMLGTLGLSGGPAPTGRSYDAHPVCRDGPRSRIRRGGSCPRGSSRRGRPGSPGWLMTQSGLSRFAPERGATPRARSVGNAAAATGWPTAQLRVASTRST
jgi:hypothetical protein